MRLLQWSFMVLCGFVMLALADDNAEAGDELSESDPRYTTVYQMPTWVKSVHSLCPWQSKSGSLEKGYIRLTHGRFDDRDRLYVQWLKTDTQQAAKVVSTREIEELKKAPLRIADFSQQLASKQCELTFKAKSLDNRYQYRLEIQLKGPGQYRFKRVKELRAEEY